VRQPVAKLGAFGRKRLRFAKKCEFIASEIWRSQQSYFMEDALDALPRIREDRVELLASLPSFS
jgi:hypothetical protein